MSVGIVVVSHSAKLAAGVAELAQQMAPGVVVAAAGGTDEGGIGTSLDKVMAAIGEADSGDGVVVLYDLGSAEMTAQMAKEFLDAGQAERLRLSSAPLVEGAVAAATAAAGGGGLQEVAAVADSAGSGSVTADAGADTGPGRDADAGADTGPGRDAEAVVRLPNALGLHARPAAAVVRMARESQAQVTVERTDTGASANARSLLSLIGLGASGGVELRVTARGPDAAAAVRRLADAVSDGFGEAAADEDPQAVRPSRGPAAAG